MSRRCPDGIIKNRLCGGTACSAVLSENCPVCGSGICHAGSSGGLRDGLCDGWADAVVEGSLMITLLKHCDRVRSASRAQLVNVIAPIMAEEHGPAWRQTTFYPFAEAALHARGQAYAPAISSPTIHTEAYGDVPAIDAVVTWDEQARTGLLLAVNRDANTPHTLTIDLSGLPGLPGLGTLALGKAQLLHEDDPYRTNTAVTPQPLDIAMNATGTCTATLPAISWISVEFHG